MVCLKGAVSHQVVGSKAEYCFCLWNPSRKSYFVLFRQVLWFSLVLLRGIMLAKVSTGIP